MCKRKIASVLLALVLLFNMALPTMTADAAVAAQPLYAYWLGELPNGGSRGELLEGNYDGTWIGDWGDEWSVLFYTDEAGTNPIPDTAAITFVPDSGTAAGTVVVANEGNNWWNIAYRGVGTGKLQVTVNGVVYERAVYSRVPYYGFSRETTLTESSYLPNGSTFTYSDTVRTFYYVQSWSNYEITGVSGAGDLNSSIDSDGKIVTFTIPAGVDAEGEYRLEISVRNKNTDKSWIWYSNLHLISAARRVVGQSDVRENGVFYETQDGTYDVSTELNPGYETGRVFYVRENGKVALAQNFTVSSSDPSVITVEELGVAANTGNTIYRIVAHDYGTANVVLTFSGGEVLTYPVRVVLPNRGFSTEPTLTQDSFMQEHSFHYTQTNRTFYFVLNRSDMTITDVQITGGLVGALDHTVNAAKNLVTFTVKSDVVIDHGGDIQVTMTHQNGGVDRNGWGFELVNDAPMMVYRWVNQNWNDLYENMNDEVRPDIELTPGYTHYVVFCLRENGIVTPLKNVTSVVSSDLSVAAATSLGKTDQGNPAYEIHGLDFGSATITVTYDGGKTLTMPVNVVLPGRGWSSAPTMTQQSFVSGEFAYTANAPTVYYIAEGLSLTSFGLAGGSAQYANCFDVQIVNTNSGSYAAVTVKPGAALPGDRWINFEGVGTGVAWNNGGTWNVGGDICFVNGDAPKLGTPSELEWNVKYDWNGGTNVKTACMGSVGFKQAASDQARYEIEFYRVGEPVPVMEDTWGWDSMTTDQYLDIAAFIHEDLPSGEYYFRLRAKGDGCNYRSGDWVESKTWVYDKPTAQLSAPTGLYWSDADDQFTMNWASPAGAEHCMVEAYYAETENGPKRPIGSSWYNYGGVAGLWNNAIATFGDGWYFFRVRSISPDITQTANSEWSVYSPAYHMGVDASVNNALGNITATGSSVAAVQQAVSSIGKLDEALAADTTNNGTVAAIEKLEADLGVSTTVNDNTAPAGFDTTGVQVTGAALNIDSNKTSSKTATLTITAVDQNNSPAALNTTQYPNAVQFAMTIPEAKDIDGDPNNGVQLAVPVKITLPVPGNINPAFLVVLHYKESTKEWEELRWPHVYQDNTGKWFATFVVDSMSPFAIVERQSTATVVNGKIELDAYLPTTGEKVEFLCAVYSPEGQMLKLVTLESHSGPVTIDAGEVREGMYLKIISANVGGGWVPVSGAQSISVTNGDPV